MNLYCSCTISFVNGCRLIYTYMSICRLHVLVRNCSRIFQKSALKKFEATEAEIINPVSGSLITEVQYDNPFSSGNMNLLKNYVPRQFIL